MVIKANKAILRCVDVNVFFEKKPAAETITAIVSINNAKYAHPE